MSSATNRPTDEPDSADVDCRGEVSLGALTRRSLFGGCLMGLANLVPGISGGTMLLAAGIYPAFIESLANLTRFRVSYRALLVLGLVAFSAGIAIVLFAGTLKGLVVDHRWAMYSLFIGLTLGGVPVVWRLTDRRDWQLACCALIAFALMVVMAVLKYMNVVGGASSSPWMLAFAGLAGASAMILPGLSGSYLLVLMGQYVPILGAIDEFKDALKARDLAAAWTPALEVLLPVGLGVIVGVVLVGNLLKWLLHRFRTATLGFLLGLLIGSVAGLYPFQEGVKPQPGDLVKGRVQTVASIDELEPEDWPTEVYRPTLVQVGSSIGLVILGFAVTLGVSRIGRDADGV